MRLLAFLAMFAGIYAFFTAAVVVLALVGCIGAA
jgi:hypothetical protein